MGCKIRWIMGFIVFVGTVFVGFGMLPPDAAETAEKAGGYATGVIFLGICVAGAFMWVTSALRIGASPYAGAQRLRASARKVAVDKGIDIAAAAEVIYAEEKAKGLTTPKVEIYSASRPVLVDRAHIAHIRESEPREAPKALPRPGYDVKPAAAPKALPAPLTWDEMAKSFFDEKARLE